MKYLNFTWTLRVTHENWKPCPAPANYNFTNKSWPKNHFLNAERKNLLTSENIYTRDFHIESETVQSSIGLFTIDRISWNETVYTLIKYRDTSAEFPFTVVCVHEQTRRSPCLQWCQPKRHNQSKLFCHFPPCIGCHISPFYASRMKRESL